MNLEADEFIRPFLIHTLPTGFARIRHYGLLAGRNKCRLLPLCQRLLAAADLCLPTPAEILAAIAPPGGAGVPVPALPNRSPGAHPPHPPHPSHLGWDEFLMMPNSLLTVFQALSGSYPPAIVLTTCFLALPEATRPRPWPPFAACFPHSFGNS